MDRLLNRSWLSLRRAHGVPRASPWVAPVVLALMGAVWGLLLARLSLLNAGLLLVLVGVSVGGFLEPLVGVGAALALGPLWAWLRAELPQVPPLIGQYVFLLTVAVWVARGLARRELRVPFPPLLFPLLCFMGITLLSLWQPADVWVGFLEWAKWGQILLMFLLVYERFQGPGGRTRVFVTVAVLAGVILFQAVVGLWQFGLRGTGPDHFAINAALGLYRAYGTFEQPNPFAGFLGMGGALLAGISLVLLLDAIRAWRWPSIAVWMIGSVAVCAGAALLASWSRGGWMGFGAALLAIVVVLPRRWGWGVALVVVVIVGGLGLYSAGLLPASIANRLTGFLAYTRFEDVRGVGINDENFAVLERMAHWQAALEMARARFWLGVGFGCYEPAYPDYRLMNWPIALGHAHNYYLNLLAETGVLGLTVYMVLLGSVFISLWMAIRRFSACGGDDWLRAIAVGLIGAWIHFGVHNLVDNVLVNNVHLHLGVLLALSAWVIKVGKRMGGKC